MSGWTKLDDMRNAEGVQHVPDIEMLNVLAGDQIQLSIPSLVQQAQLFELRLLLRR